MSREHVVVKLGGSPFGTSLIDGSGSWRGDPDQAVRKVVGQVFRTRSPEPTWLRRSWRWRPAARLHLIAARRAIAFARFLICISRPAARPRYRSGCASAAAVGRVHALAARSLEQKVSMRRSFSLIWMSTSSASRHRDRRRRRRKPVRFGRRRAARDAPLCSAGVDALPSMVAMASFKPPPPVVARQHFDPPALALSVRQHRSSSAANSAASSVPADFEDDVLLIVRIAQGPAGS